MIPIERPARDVRETTTHSNAGRRRAALAAAVSLACVLVLAGCGSSEPPAGAAAATTNATQASSVTVADAWVKAADSGMSAAFGTLTNTGGTEAFVVSASTPASTGVQLHETVENDKGEMVMREKVGGFTVAPGGSLTLEPGGNHIMLMDLTAPLTAGQEATFTLAFPDGSTKQFTAPVKDFTGADETYEGSTDMGGMDMSTTSHKH